MLKFNIEGIGPVTLNELKDYLAAGGQANLYGHRPTDLVIKIYHKPEWVIEEQKFNELHPMSVENCIIAPKHFVTAGKNTDRIGYAMAWAKDTVVWSTAMSNQFWLDNKVDTTKVNSWTEKLMKVFELIHRYGNIIGDPNEFNFLIAGKKFENVLAIDVDSYGTKSYHVSAIAPGVQDYSSKKCTQLSDWFGFAIITFMMYTGAHPYKGRHPDFGPKDMVLRMKKNVSIFDKASMMPPNVRDLSLIPPNYLGWYEKVFQDGERTPPPGIASMTGKPAVVKAPIKVISQKLQIEELASYPSPISKHWFFNGRHVILSGQKPYVLGANGSKYEVDYEEGLVKFINLTLNAKNIILMDNVLYVIQEGSMCKIDLNIIGTCAVASVGNSWELMENTARSFDGMLYQDIIGTPYLLFPNKDMLHNIKTMELQGYKIVSAKRVGRVAIVIGYKNSEYSRHLFVFNKDFTTYRYSIKNNVDNADANFAVLTTSVFAILNDDDSLEIRRLEDDKIVEVLNTGLPNDARLSSEERTVIMLSGNKLYKVTLQ